MNLQNINLRFQEALERNRKFEIEWDKKKLSRNSSSFHKQKGAYLSQIRSTKEALDKYGKGFFYQVDVELEILEKPVAMRVFYVDIYEADIEYLIRRDFKNVIKFTFKQLIAGDKYLCKNGK